ncbi:Hypothetical protein RG540_CH06750 [Neorhizobium galegae bv. orientalis str. HAMBI 540]|uniref:Uncharacterized protein n=2 Tax=Neorhizobium galegae TaxID=399 RepID=A0A068SPB7_NEOGA|nr:Hypothetical protein RG540_CH06750 [Neorhizobium galegae bv. orientalis str. HAMBI 540]
MTEFRAQMQPVLAVERPLMKTLVAEYLATTADLDRKERLNQDRRKQFFLPHFQHLTGITRAWIVSQCVMEVSRQVYDQLEAATPDADKISCDDGWLPLVDRFLIVGHKQPGFVLKSAGEKWGGLELRYRCDPVGLEACRAAEKEAFVASIETCEKCGAPGRLRGKTQWRKTLCDVHADNRYDD